MTELNEVVYTDSDGFKRVVLLPANELGENATYGIPISLDLNELWPDGPLEFLVNLNNLLIESGLVHFSDYERSDAMKLVQSAVRQAVRLDASRIIDYVRGINHDNGRAG